MEPSKDKLNPPTDAMLPAYERRTGRIGSLHEFQQRAARYDGPSLTGPSANDEEILLTDLLRDENTSQISDTYVEIAAADRSGSDGSDFLETFRKYGGRKSVSGVSLFGGERGRALSKCTYYRRQLKAVSFLVLLGVIGGPLNYGIRVLFNYLIDLREYVVDQAPSYALKLTAWIAHTVFFSGLGLFFTQLAPVAAGSGVSQMKSILTGIDPRMYLPGYFDLSTFLAKVAGLVCSVGAGLVVGTEGAYVHIMSIVTHHLLKTPVFQGFSVHLNGRLQLLAAACAVGVSSLFSSPIGGVLFSMEVTSTYYLMSNYIKAFISAVSGAIMLRLTLVLAKSESNLATQAVLKTQFPASPFSIWEIPLYVLLGAILGLLCTAMMWFLRRIAELRSAFRKSSRTWKKVLVTWIDPLAVAILTAVLTFVPGEYARHNSMDDLAILFTEDDLPSTWQQVSKYYALSVLSAVFMFLLPLCITLKIPTGIWVPTFIAGAAFGRMFGEIVAAIFPRLNAIPGTYALAGATAFGTAATRAVSVAVITLEITAAMSMILPLFCSSLAAMAVSSLFKEKSVYDTLLVVSGMPFLPLVDFEPTMTASDIVEPCLVYITKRTTIARILLALQRLPHHEIPVVDNEATMVLLGVVSGSQLRRFVRKHYELNGIGGVDEDLGEKPQSSTPVLSWATLKDKLTLNTRTENTGGFNGMGSIDITYNALSTQKPHVIGAVPFLMDDAKMLGLLNEGWDNAKAEKLNATVKITEGRLCVIRPMAMTISSNTPLDDLHMIFTMLRCDHCFVCDHGALEGVVTTKGLLRSAFCHVWRCIEQRLWDMKKLVIAALAMDHRLVSAVDSLQDQLLPAHRRRTGRIESLHEFQQRAASYDHEDGATEDYLVDVDARSEDADALDAFRKYAAQRSMSSGSLFGGERERAKNKRKYYRRQCKAVSFLVLLGVIGGPLNYGIRTVCQELLDLRDTLVSHATSEVARYFIWTGHTVAFSLLGLLLTRIAPVAAGSGVSQMKAILTGIDPGLYLPGYFDFATLVIKTLGLTCSVGAGLVVGTEGCNVHIMSIVTHHLLRLPVYCGFSSHVNGRIQLLAAACAVGVSSLFSSPVGGVLFSMEVTATYYFMSNYIKAFISAVSGAVMLRLTLVLAKSTSKQATTAILATSFGEHPYSIWEIPLYMLMGGILGFLCVAMIKLLRVIAETRRDLRKSSEAWKRALVEWLDPILVAVLCGTLTYVPGEVAHSTTIYTLSTLFTESELPDAWYKFSKFYTLSVLPVIFMFLLPVCISLKMPTGVWVPTFIGGAAFGRLFGETLSTLFPSIGATPGAYALAGAAAFGSAATKAVSVAVITLEITGEMSLILPIFCAVLAAMATSSLFSERSVYDTLLVVSGTPFLPILDFEPDACAGDIVEVFTVYITKKTTVAKLLLALHRLPNQDIPVVQDEKSMVLLGIVSSAHLKKFVRAYYLANGLNDVEQDLGEEQKSSSSGFSWATMVDGIGSKQTGGLNGDVSVDETYSALTTSRASGPIPFLMNDDKMLTLLSDGWSAFKRAKLNDRVNVTDGNACVIQPLGMTISSSTSLGDVHMLFTMLRCDHCFVCDRGSLEGVVTMKGLLHSGKRYCNS